jgi:hypothetical protein
LSTITKTLLQTNTVTLLSTELNSLANNSLAISSVGGSSGAFNFAIGGTDLDGYQDVDIELYIASMGGTPTAQTGFSIWFLGQVDGTNYEDGSASVEPARSPDCVIPIRAVSTAQRIIRRQVAAPHGTVKALIKNNGTGQALASSGNTLKIKASTDTQV